MRKERRNISAQDKVAILRRHLVDKVPVSDLCDEHQIQPAQFYQWQKQFFENGAAAFTKSGRQKRDFQAERIATLEQKLVKKNEVVPSRNISASTRLARALDTSAELPSKCRTSAAS